MYNSFMFCDISYLFSALDIAIYVLFGFLSLYQYYKVVGRQVLSE